MPTCSLIKVKSIAECSLGAFCNTFDLHSAIIGLENQLLSPLGSQRDIVSATSVRLSIPSVHTFCLSGTISQYLLVSFDSFLVQMISTMDSRYPISLVKINPLTLELLPLLVFFLSGRLRQVLLYFSP